MQRRQFLQAGAMVAGSGMAWSAAAAETPAASPLPTIRLGSHVITRLVAGSNPLSGYSYLGSHSDQHMREYFTLERTVEFLLACERAGINCHQFSTGTGKAEAALRAARDKGSKLAFVCLHGKRDDVASVAKRHEPIAMAHHGGVTDRFLAEGKFGLVRDFVKAVKDQGLLAGVSAHNPACIQRAADEGWEVDFFMTCFDHLTRKSFDKTAAPSETLELVYPFHRNDPAAMTRVIRQVKQPCLAFKILAAGRLCGDQNAVRGAFRYAFENIKPTDAVIVGMYPRFFDEIAANAQYAREVAKPA